MNLAIISKITASRILGWNDVVKSQYPIVSWSWYVNMWQWPLKRSYISEFCSYFDLSNFCVASIVRSIFLFHRWPHSEYVVRRKQLIFLEPVSALAHFWEARSSQNLFQRRQKNETHHRTLSNNNFSCCYIVLLHTYLVHVPSNAIHNSSLI